MESLGVNDSKKLSAAKRQKLAEIIKSECLFHNTVFIDVPVINTLGIGEATHYGADKLVTEIKQKYHNRSIYLLMDGFPIHDQLGNVLDNQTAIIRGDCLSISIAAASIIAKVARDEYMKNLSFQYPEYGFDHHVGYGTAEHRAAVRKYGATELHRRDFVRKTMNLKR